MQSYYVESPNKAFIQYKSRGDITVIETDDVEYVGFLVDFQKIVEAVGVNYNDVVDSPDVAGRSINLTFWRRQEAVVDKIIRQTRHELLKDNRLDHFVLSKLPVKIFWQFERQHPVRSSTLLSTKRRFIEQ